MPQPLEAIVHALGAQGGEATMSLCRNLGSEVQCPGLWYGSCGALSWHQYAAREHIGSQIDSTEMTYLDRQTKHGKTDEGHYKKPGKATICASALQPSPVSKLL